MRTRLIKPIRDNHKQKAKHPNLSESDLQFESGKKNKTFNKVQTNLGKSFDELPKIISKL